MTLSELSKALKRFACLWRLSPIGGTVEQSRVAGSLASRRAVFLVKKLWTSSDGPHDRFDGYSFNFDHASLNPFSTSEKAASALVRV
jgi:hypothetical protein